MPANRRPLATRQGKSAPPPSLLLIPGDLEAAPEPPRGLLKTTRETWQAYWSSQVSRAVDRAADAQRLERWIHAVDQWHRANRTLRRFPLVKGSMGQPVLSPLADYVAKLERTIATAEEEFGMTPRARLRLGLHVADLARTAADLNAMIADDEEPDDADEDALRREWESG
jgi:P27 family predicted phage terminase small subunit